MERKPRLSLDALVVEALGQFGRFQARTLVLCWLYVVLVAFSSSAYVFTTARIPSRCIIPECDTTSPVFLPPWLANAVPAAGGGFDNCARFINITAPNATLSEACPASMFNRSVTLLCENYVYANSYSVVYDFELACDEWRRSLIGSFRLGGAFISLPLTGAISDRWGRRSALVYSSLSTAAIGLSRALFASNYSTYVTFEVLESAIASSGFTCAYILVMELVGLNYRIVAGASMNTFYSVGQVLLALIAMLVPDWRRLTMTLYSPQLLSITFLWLMSESIRWLISKGRYEESEDILKKAARINKKSVSESSLKILRVVNEEIKDGKTDKSPDEQWLVLLVFRHRPVLLRCLVCPVLWVTHTLVNYGLSLNAVNLSGNSFANYAAVSAVEIPGYWLAVFLINFLGRKPVLTGAYWMCAACMAGFMLLPDHLFAFSLVLYLFGKFCIAMVGTSIYIYTTEVFPTRYRHRLFAYCSMIGRIGSITAPLTPALGETIWSQLPFVLFAAFCVTSGLLMFLLPETLGAKLPETMEEADHLGNRNKK